MGSAFTKSTEKAGAGRKLAAVPLWSTDQVAISAASTALGLSGPLASPRTKLKRRHAVAANRSRVAVKSSTSAWVGHWDAPRSATWS